MHRSDLFGKRRGQEVSGTLKPKPSGNSHPFHLLDKTCFEKASAFKAERDNTTYIQCLVAMATGANFVHGSDLFGKRRGQESLISGVVKPKPGGNFDEM